MNRYLDLAIAVWVVFTGGLFVLPMFAAALGSENMLTSAAELVDLSRSVYVIVLAACLTTAALGAARKITGKDKQ
ncbi:MAG: hypothetical protein ABFD54_12025 [Armatimonadota bacterium]|nr:hypothetical protein [bacterium]